MKLSLLIKLNTECILFTSLDNLFFVLFSNLSFPAVIFLDAEVHIHISHINMKW